MPDESTRRIFVIEDDPDARANLVDILELDDYEVDTAGTAAEAIQGLRKRPCSIVIIDRQLPDGTADEFLPALKQVAPESAFIVVTGYSDLDGAIAAIRQGADDYILKPLNPDALRNSLRRLAEQRRLSQEKERSEATFRHLVEEAECLIVLLKRDLTILYFSPYGERVTKYRASEILGRDFSELFLPAPQRNSFDELAKRVLEKDSVRGYQTSLICREGSARSMLWNLRRVDEYLEEPVVLAVGQDITELKRIQEQSLQAERLAAIGQMVAGLAHESRNALQRSQACLELLSLLVKDRPGALDYLTRLQKAQDDLTRLYEDVRQFASPIKLECRDCRLPEIWREAWEHLDHLRTSKEAQLIEVLGLPENVTVQADAFRLGQVFRNIFDNAMAAGSAPVKIVVSVSGTRLDDREAVEISVQDNGPGLNAEQRAKVFDTFYTTKTKGTGLGMPISKRIVEAHGGVLTVGEGTRRGLSGAEFVITLPRSNP